MRSGEALAVLIRISSILEIDVPIAIETLQGMLLRETNPRLNSAFPTLPQGSGPRSHLCVENKI